MSSDIADNHSASETESIETRSGSGAAISSVSQRETSGPTEPMPGRAEHLPTAPSIDPPHAEVLPALRDTNSDHQPMKHIALPAGNRPHCYPDHAQKGDGPDGV